jgi:RNA polymerase sigma factor (sigma-70 family)
MAAPTALRDPNRNVQDDPSVWRAAAAGDPELRAALVERACQSVAVALRRFADSDQEDIRQAIAESVLRALATGLCPHANVDAFLHWRGRAEITAFVRKRIRERRLADPDAILALADRGSSPLRRLELAELAAILRACGESVPNATHREAFRQRFLVGLEPRELAAKLGATPELARVWIARAATVVRRCIERRLADRRDGAP